MKAVILIVVMSVGINAFAKSSASDIVPFYPSTELQTKMDQIGADECVVRIDPPTVNGYAFRPAGAMSGYGESYSDASVATYLQTISNNLYHARTYTGATTLFSSAVKTQTIPFVVKNQSSGEKSLKYISSTASVRAVVLDTADASALTIGHLMDVDMGINAVLLGLPDALKSVIDGAIDRFNQAVINARAKAKNKATLKVSEVTEQRIDTALEIIGDAQAVLLIQYACPNTDVSGYASALNSYLNRLTIATNNLSTN